MDQTTQTQSPALPQNILSEEQKNQLFADLGLETISPEKKQELMNTMIDTVLNRLFARIASVLTDEDEKMLADLELRPESENAPMNYLLSIVPNLDAIATEEIATLREEMEE